MGDWIYSDFSYVEGFLWVGKFGQERENPDFLWGGGVPNPLGHHIVFGFGKKFSAFFENN